MKTKKRNKPDKKKPGREKTMFTDIVKLGKKGQITLPKKIRDEDDYQDGDEFKLTRTPGGDMILRKKTEKTPEDLMIEAIHRMRPFDFNTAWAEVQKERRLDRG